MARRLGFLRLPCSCSRASRGPGHARRRLYAARRHAGDPGRRDDLHRLHGSDRAQEHRRRRQQLHAELVQRRPRPTSTSPATSRTSSRSASRPTSSARPAPAARARGSYVFRLKYAFAQFNLDDWMTRGSWARFGMQQTPWIDFIDSDLPLPLPGPDVRGARRHPVVVGRRRVVPLQLREATTATSTPASTTATTTTAPKPTIRRRWMTRGTVRPLPASVDAARLRVTGFYNMRRLREGRREAPRHRRRRPTNTPTSTPASTTSSTTRPGAGSAAPKLDGDGYSVWVTPKTPKGYGWSKDCCASTTSTQEQIIARSTASATAPSPASRTGSAPGRGVDARCSSTTSRWTTTTTRRCAPTRRRWAVHALINF